MTPSLRLNIFIDFWNFTLLLKKHDPHFLVDWFKVASVFTRRAGILLETIQPDISITYQTCHVIGSYGPNDVKLESWSKNTLSRIPGCRVNFLRRQKQKTAFCCTGSEHHELINCPTCGEPMLGYKEKGVDTTIAITMLREAWENLYDIAILVSSDKDFIPAVEYLHHLSKRCIHAGFSGWGNELAAASWASLNINNFSMEFTRSNN